MRRKLTLLLAAVLSVPLLLGGAIVVRADAPGGAEGAEGAAAPRRLEHLKKKLALTDDQVATIRAAFEADRDQRRDIRTRMKAAMEDLRKAALDGADAATLRQKTDAATALWGKMLALRSDELKKIGATLTPEQRAQFARMHEHGGGRGRGHGGHHGRGSEAKDGAEPSQG